MKFLNYKAFALAAMSFIAFSCDTDGEYNEVVDANVIDINAQLDVRANAIGEGAPTLVSVTLPQSFASDATVRVVVRSDDSRQGFADLELPAGETTTSGLVTLAGNDGVDTNLNSFDQVEFYVAGLALSEGVVGEAYNVTSNRVSLALYDRVPFPNPIDNSMEILFDWENPGGNDLDLFVVLDNTTAVDVVESGSRYEVSQVTPAEPDGVYSVVAFAFSAADSDIDYIFFFRQPDGELRSFGGEFTNVAAGDFLFPDPMTEVTFTKTGSDYTFNN